MPHVTFHIGLARRTQEIAFKGYKRQPLVLSLDDGCDDLSNLAPIVYEPALLPWGLIDGFTLSTSPDGPVVAVSPLLLPVFIAAGSTMRIDAHHVIMGRKSLDAILNRDPVLVGPGR